MSDEPQADPVTKVARDLSAIVELYIRLLSQAVQQAGHPMMPGGPAMAALGNVANMESWENQQQATERYHDHADVRLRRCYTSVEDEDPDEAWSAFQLLEFWSEGWRAEHGAEYGQRPSIATEASFLRWSLNWAWDNEPAWDDFARDVNLARVKLENILTAGHRVERTRVSCNTADCLERQAQRGIEKPSPRNLIRLVEAQGREDVWKCPGCRTRYDSDAFDRAYAAMMRSKQAEKYVTARDAVAVLKEQGTPGHTVRRWLSPPERHTADRCVVCKRSWPPQEHAACPGLRLGEACGGDLKPVIKRNRDAIVGGYCDIGTRMVWVWWPDLWTKHLLRKARDMSA